MPSRDPQPPALSTTVEPDPSPEDSATQEVVIGTGVQGTQTIFGDTNDVSVERDRELLDQGGQPVRFRFGGSRSLRVDSDGACLFQSFASIVSNEFLGQRSEDLLAFLRQRWDESETYIMAHIENPLTMFLRDIPRRQNGQPFESWEEFESWFRQERPKHAQIRIMVVLMTVLRWQESYHGTVVPDYMIDMMGPERFVHFLNPAHYFQFMSRETEFGTQNEIVNFSRLFRMRVRVADISLNRTIDSTDEPNIEWPWFALRFSGESLDGL
ncbi:Beta-galactoside alpha-2,6-sialyltransferase 2, partial [Frankliniella fusca]